MACMHSRAKRGNAYTLKQSHGLAGLAMTLFREFNGAPTR